MTKADAFEKAWWLGLKGDFSLVDEIYHREYKSYDLRVGIKLNLNDDKVLVSTLSDTVVFGRYRTIFEENDFLCIHRYFLWKEANTVSYGASVVAITYKEEKIITQESIREIIDCDPSEGQNWNWEDHE